VVLVENKSFLFMLLKSNITFGPLFFHVSISLFEIWGLSWLSCILSR